MLFVEIVKCTGESVSVLFSSLPLFSLLQRNSALLSEEVKLRPLQLTTCPTFMLQMEPIPIGKLLDSFFTDLKCVWMGKFNLHRLKRFIAGK